MKPESFLEILFSDNSDIALFTELYSALPYAGFICPELGDTTNLTVLPEMSYLSFMCLVKLSMGQSLLDMFLKLRIQNYTIPGDIFRSYAVYPEESGTSKCVSIKVAYDEYESQSGVMNGVETIIDLETYDNGDLGMIGDGAYVQVTEPEDYPLAKLKGFSVGPGQAVEVHIKPSLFTITKSALNRFDYLERKCVEPSVDKELEDLDGIDNNDYDYSISNCLVSAVVTVMDDEDK